MSRLEPVELLGVVDRHELRGRLLEPREQVADLVDDEVLKAGVALGFRRRLGDVELVVDVAVEAKALGLDRRDRLPRKLERNRDVAEEAAARRLGDHGPLVADDGIVDPELERVGANGLEHPPGHDHDVDAGRAGGVDRGPSPLAEHERLGHQRPVEVAGERLDLGGKAGREAQLFGLRKATRSPSCLSSSCSPYVFGMSPGWKPSATSASGFTIEL